MRPRATVLFVTALVVAVPALPSSQPPPTLTQLDRYLAGQFDAVVRELEAEQNFGRILKDLEDHGTGWIDARGPDGRERRRLAAATFALEAARVDVWREWKVRTSAPAYLSYTDEDGRRRTPDILSWSPPPLLIEWGCRLFRRDETRSPHELAWQWAALSVAQRSQDFEFLFGDEVTNIYNPEVEIDHLFHARKRFPTDPRLTLAQGIVAEWRLPEKARTAFEEILTDQDVGGEAAMRLGALHFRQGNHDRATDLFERVESMTRDPWVVYLARHFKGQSLERQKKPIEAARAYRAALAAMPGVGSASIALASLLASRNQRGEAEALVAAMFATRPAPVDPWREYANADDRFWPRLIGGLRAEILR